jgi:CubicO group peptidase (beta-lactamase class C family)
MRPLAVPGLLALLAGPAAAQDWSGLEASVQRGIASRLYPGAVVVVGTTDSILYARGFGRFSWDARSQRPHPDSTLWDLASLTKVMATASAAMRLWERGALELDAPVARYLPDFTGSGRERITIRMLLDHSSGLRAWAPLWRDYQTRDGAVHGLLAEQPTRAPGTVTRYSDLNAMLLGLVLEAVGQAPLDEVAAREVFHPLGLADTRFGVPPADLVRTAPSRIEGGRPSAGTVNDDNARRFRGVAGHAGLFSSGLDVARFAQAWLALARGRDLPWAAAVRARRFLESAPGFRPLGWASSDTTLDRSSFGSLTHRDVVGHNGWTGTQLWLDPTHDLFVVFLTNRAISPRGNGSLDPMRLVRADVSDAVHRTVAAMCPRAGGVVC